jgi:phosphoglycerol transferase MdoB-like AlkP superfamily enzyme
MLTCGFVIAAAVCLTVRGGFRNACESLQDSYTHTCVTPMYTVFGSMYYDYIHDREVFTDETGRFIRTWLDGELTEAAPLSGTRKNCIIILAESLESWVLEQTVEGQELTPCLNRLLREETTLYAPRVLSQVKGGRSIDAQLMINCGLLPVEIGVYSLKYPQNTYPSLEKAMKSKYGTARAVTMTADKPMVWNQIVINKAFGFDSLLSRNNFIQDEQVGPHYRHQLGDVSLLRQCAAKIRKGEVWQDSVANLIQIVTYSGHFPFALPEHLREVGFSDTVPMRMRDYMTVAHYTDRALGQFIEELRLMKCYDNTLIMITGDHEGLVDMRSELTESNAGRGIVSDKPFVPVIILNMPTTLPTNGGDKYMVYDDSPKSVGCMRYEAVMGQIDIYPSLIDLLGLSDCEWSGLGSSIMNPSKKGLAIDAQGKVYGDEDDDESVNIHNQGSADVLKDDKQRLKDAWKVSDCIIRYDYFGISKHD